MPYPAYGSSRRLKQRRPAQAQRRLAGIIEWSSMESPAAEKQKPSHRLGSLNKWCPDSESNQGHGDFQSPALPTELSGQRGALNRNRRASSTKFICFAADCTIYHHIALKARVFRQKTASRPLRSASPAPAQAAYSPRQTFLFRRCAARWPPAAYRRRR